MHTVLSDLMPLWSAGLGFVALWLWRRPRFPHAWHLRGGLSAYALASVWHWPGTATLLARLSVSPSWAPSLELLLLCVGGYGGLQVLSDWSETPLSSLEGSVMLITLLIPVSLGLLNVLPSAGVEFAGRGTLVWLWGTSHGRVMKILDSESTPFGRTRWLLLSLLCYVGGVLVFLPVLRAGVNLFFPLGINQGWAAEIGWPLFYLLLLATCAPPGWLSPLEPLVRYRQRQRRLNRLKRVRQKLVERTQIQLWVTPRWWARWWSPSYVEYCYLIDILDRLTWLRDRGDPFLATLVPHWESVLHAARWEERDQVVKDILDLFEQTKVSDEVQKSLG